MTEKQKQLAERHGTPEQFEKAIWKAWDDLLITSGEADAAIKKYHAKWDAAGTQGETMSEPKADSGAAVPCIPLLAVSAIVWLTTVVMIVAAFIRNDPALVGASAYCFIAASALLAFAVCVFKANAPLSRSSAEAAGSERDWQGDFCNGSNQYECHCSVCQRPFFGDKRRTVCRLCSVANK